MKRSNTRFEQVLHHAGERIPVADDPGAGDGGVDAQGGVLTGATDRLQHDVVEIELVVGERHTGVDPGQAVAVVDQPGQPLGVLAQRGELLAPRRVVVQCGDLELRAQGGHRGADLVGGVGDELPLPSGGGLGPAAEAVRRAAARAGLPADVVVEVTATVRPDGSMAPL